MAAGWIASCAALALLALGISACASDPPNEVGTIGTALEDCGPEPHYKAVDGQCLPSCGVAGGNLCWDSPVRFGMFVDKGRTWDCAYCYDSPFLH
jgi:hypothetical protein